MRLALVPSVFVLLIAVSSSATAVPAGEAPSQGAVWDLSPLFSDGDAWERERVAIEAALPGVAALQDELVRSPASLADGLNRISELERRLRKLQAYASLKADEDARSAVNQARAQRGDALSARFDSTVVFVDRVVLALGPERVLEYERTEPRLAPRRRELDVILRRRSHTLSADAENVLAAAKPLQQLALKRLA